MKYNGKKLIEMTPENWDGKSREMLVWDGWDECTLRKLTLIGYDSVSKNWITSYPYKGWHHCAEIPVEEKEDVMNKFSNNEIQILVSTSVIEVGVNVVNATTMVILDADRFGIAQLHQMRGRVRRSDDQAYCFLVSDTLTQSSIDRLKLVEENSDGFVLAEEDLVIRGPGDFFGEKQTGMVPFRMADIIIDKDLFEQANNVADEMISNEKLFNEEEYKELLNIVDTNYKNNKEMLD